MRDLMTLEEVAKYLRVSKRTASRHLGKAGLCVRVGRQIRVSRDQLDTFEKLNAECPSNLQNAMATGTLPARTKASAYADLRTRLISGKRKKN